MVEKIAAGWLGKLVRFNKGATGKHKAELANISDELGVFAEQLAPLFIEPDLQLFSPVKDDPHSSLRTPAFTDFQDRLNDKTIRDDGSRQLFILADGGMGKSSLLAMIKLGNINKFWPSRFVFVVMKVGPDTLDRIRHLEDRERTVLLLDSLDGDASGKVKERVVALLKATQNFYRVVITCRTPFMPKADDSTFWHKGRVKIEDFTCPVMHLSVFSDSKAEAYLAKKFKRRKAELPKAEKLAKKLGDLHLRPMLLAYIDDLMDVKDLDDLDAIYTTLMEAWLDRETREPDSPLKKNELLKASLLLARFMMKEGQRVIIKEKLSEFLQDHPEGEHLNLVDVGGRSLLNKNSNGEFCFARLSFQEFLAVQTIKTMGWHGRITEMMAKFMRCLCLSETNLSGADLAEAKLDGAKFGGSNLSGVNLRGADLRGADLNGAYLFEANLVRADLMAAVLAGADLVMANLGGADLSGANLCEVDLSGANLSEANLSGVDLLEANLSGTHLRGANLVRTNLSEVDLSRADLSNANLEGLQNWREVSSWDEANIYNIRTAPEGFRQWVMDAGGIEKPAEEG